MPETVRSGSEKPSGENASSSRPSRRSGGAESGRRARRLEPARRGSVGTTSHLRVPLRPAAAGRPSASNGYESAAGAPGRADPAPKAEPDPGRSILIVVRPRAKARAFSPRPTALRLVAQHVAD